MKYYRITATICGMCLEGKGGECHEPGCLFWISAAPDIPIKDRVEIHEESEFEGSERRTATRKHPKTV